MRINTHRRPSLDLAARVRELVERDGLVATATLLGVGRTDTLRIAGGLRVRPESIDQARRIVDDLEVPRAS